MVTQTYFNLLRSCGLVLALGLTVQGAEFSEQLSEAVEELSVGVTVISDLESVDPPEILQTSLFNDLGVSTSQSSCCDSVCGSSCESSCCNTGCSTGCNTACGNSCGNGCGCESKFLGIFQKTPCGFDDFISPITNPVFFEDPRTLSELRFFYLNHQTPRALGADTIQVAAMQIRAAITDRLSLVAAKDGFIMSDSPLVDDGWADVAVGLKYNLFRDVCKQQLLSVGAAYEMPVGSLRSLQGNGAGEFNLYMTGGTEIAEDWHWLSASGVRLPANTTSESSVFYWSNHIDCKISDKFYVLAEANWFHWMGAGGGGVPGIEGNDLFNLGSTGVAGNDIVSGALGFKYKASRNSEIGFAWETPLTDRRDLLDDRYTVDWIVRF